jgi:glycosyltransferase involved in cell wall biosynthesis
MRITFVLPTVDMGGGTRVVMIYAQALVRMGHSVRLVSTPPLALPLPQKIKYWLNGNGWPVPSMIKSHLDGSGLDLKVLERARPVTNDDVGDADVVIATWWETAEWVNGLSADKGAKVYFIQGHEIFSHLPVARCHATYRLPLHKIVVSRWLKDVMQIQYGDQVVDLVPNSVDHRQFFAPIRDKQSTPTVGFVYSANPLKGMDTLFAALQMLRERIPVLRLISFGPKRPSTKLPLPQGVEFFISPRQDELRNLYSQCDVWVTASRSEGFNLPTLEAMACRTPVVATRTGWPVEGVKSGWNGALIDVNDQAGLAEAVEWVLSRKEQEWRSLSSNAYQTAIAAGSWQSSAEMFEKALEHACRRSVSREIAGYCACLSER